MFSTSYQKNINDTIENENKMNINYSITSICDTIISSNVYLENILLFCSFVPHFLRFIGAFPSYSSVCTFPLPLL